MRVKRFVADSMQAAVALVRGEFGQDALIINTRKVRRRSFFSLLKKPQYEVIAALDRPRGNESEQLKHARHTMNNSHTEQGQIQSESMNSQSSHASELNTQFTSQAGRTVPLEQLHRHLIQQDVEDHLADELTNEVEAAALNGDLLLDVEWISKTAETCLANRVVCTDPEAIGNEGRIVPLVGPTGVGKTTTIAKLAANFALLAQKNVAIVTADTYRIAAVEQLKTYADLIGVPLEVVYSPEELADALARLEDMDLIFVDTAGRSQRHDAQMNELRSFLNVIDQPLTHLVISATTKLSDAIEITTRFGTISYDRLIITKVDETSTFGTVLSLLHRTSKKLSYMTNGQNVPDDIEVALPSRVADLIMRGRV